MNHLNIAKLNVGFKHGFPSIQCSILPSENLANCILEQFKITKYLMYINAKATPTNDVNYSCHIKAIELI